VLLSLRADVSALSVAAPKTVFQTFLTSGGTLGVRVAALRATVSLVAALEDANQRKEFQARRLAQIPVQPEAASAICCAEAWLLRACVRYRAWCRPCCRRWARR
jgi:hypothetical protein